MSGKYSGFRLFWFHGGPALFFRHSEVGWISNSVACLLTTVDATVNPNYPDYYDDFRSIIFGIRVYKRALVTSAGKVTLVYFHNVVWDGHRMRIEPKPAVPHEVSTFAAYRTFLESSMQLVTANLQSKSRKHSWQMRSTASSGYDSATVSLLAKQYGCTEVITFDQARGGDPDSGAEIVNKLGMTPVVLQRDGWRNYLFPEALFLASDSKAEDVYFRSADENLAGTVLFTGFAGGKMWKKHPVDVSEDIIREDQSGLSLTEYRLHAGFIHCPVPFWGIRHVRDVNRMSTSPDMSPWDFPAGYSKPFCRRMLEEAGVPREMFGMQNRAASVLLWRSDRFLTPKSMEDYLRWLQQYCDGWHRQTPARIAVYIDTALCGGLYRFESACARLLDFTERVRGGSRLAAILKLRKIAYLEDNPLFLRRYVFPWALAKAQMAYEVKPMFGKQQKIRTVANGIPTSVG